MDTQSLLLSVAGFLAAWSFYRTVAHTEKLVQLEGRIEALKEAHSVFEIGIERQLGELKSSLTRIEALLMQKGSQKNG